MEPTARADRVCCEADRFVASFKKGFGHDKIPVRIAKPPLPAPFQAAFAALRSSSATTSLAAHLPSKGRKGPVTSLPRVRLHSADVVVIYVGAVFDGID